MMKFKRLRRYIRKLVSCPGDMLILKENELINQLIQVKCFTGIKHGEAYLKGLTIQELVSLIWPEHSWERFPVDGGIIAITSLQISQYPGNSKFFLGRLAVALDAVEGLSIQVLTKESDYYTSQKDLFQNIDLELLNRLKSLTVH